MQPGVVRSRHGRLIIDMITGLVLDASGYDPEGQEFLERISRVDLKEYRKNYAEMPTDFNLLDLGHWRDKNAYWSACPTYREEKP